MAELGLLVVAVTTKDYRTTTKKNFHLHLPNLSLFQVPNEGHSHPGFKAQLEPTPLTALPRLWPDHASLRGSAFTVGATYELGVVAALRGTAEERPAAVAGGRGAVVHVLGGHRGAAHEAQVYPCAGRAASGGEVLLLVRG